MPSLLWGLQLLGRVTYHLRMAERDSMAHTKVWTTRDGRKVRVCDMEDSHLINTIRYLDKYYLEYSLAYCYLPEPNGQHAQDAFEAECAALADGSPGDLWPIYDDMVAEAQQRKLRYTN